MRTRRGIAGMEPLETSEGADAYFAIWRNTGRMAGKPINASPDEVFKALGSPGRLTLVRTLVDGERCVCDLVDAVGLGWSTTSRHLDVLREAGVVTSEKRGQKIFYRLELGCVAHFIACLDQARGRRGSRAACGCG
jgi:ArsR family transcriptional regulator